MSDQVLEADNMTQEGDDMSVFKIKSNLTVKMDHQQTQSQDSIQVVVRIKPGNQEHSVAYTPNQIQLEKHTFAFDRIFPPEAQQEDIFHAVGKKLLMNTLEGYNSCIFAYGQTGSGKTHTMMGNNNGLMQRSFIELFNRMNRLTESECIVTCSYYELYNEQINDLLDTRKEKKNLSIRQDVRKGVFVENLTQESVLCAQKLNECLTIGMKNRHIGETMMNRQSSRSHSIFTIALAIKSEVDGKKVLKTPKLHFVDLAGSERQKMTNSSGQRLKQAGNINKSLTTLGMVINALASDKSKTHIPYRDSKLTCLLRDSLGGNSKTFIVATISTSILCFQQTLSTLNFANRAKMVKVKALINEESLSTNIEQFKEEIRKLRQEISRLKSEKRVNFENHTPASEPVIPKNSGDLQSKFAELTGKIEDLKSNMGNSNIDDVLKFLNKAKEQEMQDESQQKMEEQGNQLIKYMLSNHQLLKKIHQAVNDYTSLREEIKNVQFSRRMPLEQIKTPSKFERDQYEDLVEKRQAQIKMLQERVASLKELNLNKEVEIRQLRRKVTSMEDHTESKEESLARLLDNQEDLQKRHSELSLRHQLVREEKLRLQKQVDQLESRLKESKQLYHYAEQKYENERSIRNKLETSIRELNKKVHLLEEQKKEIIEDFESKIYGIEEKSIEAERREEELKSQIDILNETVQFDRKKMKEYSDKVTESNKIIQELTQAKFNLGQQVTLLEHQKQQATNHYQHLLGELRLKNKELENNRQLLREELVTVQFQSNTLQKEYEKHREVAKERINRLEQQVQKQISASKTACYELETFKIEHQKVVLNLQATQFDTEKLLQNTNSQLLNQKQAKQLLQQKSQNDKELYDQDMHKMTLKNQTLTKEVANLAQQAEVKDKKISQLDAHVQSTKNIAEDYEQLKKTYKEVIKENYKLKGQYISNSSSSLSEAAKNEELISKVAYYEQKFRLMSIQYNKVQQVGKKLKQKELTLMKKLEYYEQSQKVKKLQNSSDHQEAKGQSVKMLQLQNSELKESLSKLSRMYQNKIHSEKKEDYSKRVNLQQFKYELELKQEKMRKRLQNAIKNWDHAKENNCSGMQLEDLFGCWEKLENESRKKIEGINRSIKREQKLKIQNGFIIKQNAYLKERVQALEREINLSGLCQPRKQVKLDAPQE